MEKAVVLIAVIALFSCGKNSDIRTSISSFTGSVSINGKLVSDAGVKISYNDVIETGAGSLCEIIINDKNILRIGGNTKFVFRISEKENILELKSGWLAGVTKKAFTKEGSYQIYSPAVIASVRGTSFCVKTEAENSTYFCVCNGSINLEKESGGAAELVTSAHHAARVFKKNYDGSVVVDKNAGLKYHDDKGVEMLAAKVGTTLDWSKPD